MEYIVIAFRSRAHTIKFHSFLDDNRIKSEIINTPKDAGVGCGLSVRLPVNLLETAKKAVRLTSLPSYAGIFKVKMVGGKMLVRSI